MLKRVVSFNTIVLRKNYLQLYSYTESVIHTQRLCSCLLTTRHSRCLLPKSVSLKKTKQNRTVLSKSECFCENTSELLVRSLTHRINIQTKANT